MNASRLLKIAVAVFLVHGMSLCDDKIDEYRHLRELIGQTKFPEALEICGSLILEYPTYVPLYEAYAEICLYSDKLDEGERFFESRLREGRELGLSYFGAGLVEYHRREYKTAALLFDKAITSGVDAPECYNMLERSYEKHEGIEPTSRYFSLLCNRHPENANHWYGLALAYWGRNDAGRVSQYIENAIQRRPTEPRYLQLRAAVLYLAGDVNDARQVIGSLLASCLDRADYQGYFFLQSHRISTLLITSQQEEAISITQGLLSIARQYGYFRWEGWAYLKQADAMRLGGDLEGSAVSASRSIRAATLAHDLELTLASLDRTIDVYLDLGMHESAIEDCLKRVLLAQEKGYERHFVRGLMDLGRAYYLIGKYDLAIEYISESLARSEGLYSDIATTIQMRSALGLTYLAMGKHREALANLKIGLECVPNKSIWGPARADLVGQVGRCLIAMGNTRLAYDYLTRQSGIAKRIGSSRAHVEANVNFGDYYLARNELHQAEGFYTRALVQAQSLQLWDETVRSLRGVACVYEGLHNSTKAIDAYSRLFEILDRKRLPIVESLPFHSFNREFREDTKAYIDLLLQTHNIERAFDASELLKLRETIDPLSIALRAGYSTNDRLSVGQANMLRKDIARLYSQLPDSRRHKLFDDSFLKNMNSRNEIASKELNFLRVLDTLALRVPNLHRRLQPYPDSHLMIQKRLTQPNRAILEYSVCAQRTIVFVVKLDTLAAIQLPIGRDALNTLLANLTPLLNSRKEVESIWNPIVADFSTRASAILFNTLVAPLMHLLADVKALTIIPDDGLRNLPFETLCMTPIDSLPDHDFARTPFLVERFEINYELAASSNTLAPHSIEAKKPILVMGNEKPLSDAESSGSNSFMSNNKAYGDDGALSLPGVRREVQKISKIFRETTSSQDGESMSKERFISIANQYRIIHLASHFQWDDQYPLASFLALPSRKGSENEERFRVYEVPTLDLDAEMIVLSGCNTARWSNRTMTYGFIRGILSGGTISVVGSLWPIDDDATADLMVGFYHHLKSGCNTARALQLAKIDMIRDGRSDPFYWGGFVLIGRSKSIELSSLSGRENRAWFPATIGISIGVITLFMAIRFSLKVLVIPRKAKARK